MAICAVCCEEINNSNRKECICPKCNFSACKSCIRTYLGSTPNESHCMNCKFEWNDSFVLTAINKTYYHKELKEQKKQKFFEIEKSKLAESQIEAKQFLIKENGKKEIDAITKEIRALHQQIHILKFKRREIEIDISKKIKKEQKSFIMRCQASNCNGFVNKSYKCELCEKTTCSKCFEIVEENHECKPESIETAKVIKEGSRPCPKCAVRISKTDGCSQMWCTNCQTPFDWVSGLEIKNQNIHNPHYFQYLQNGNAGVVPRNPQDVLCGGMPHLDKFRTYSALKLHDKDIQKFITTNAYNIYRFVGHIQHIMRTDINRAFEEGVELCRIKLILNRIDEDTFKQQVFKHYTLRNKRTVNNRLLDTLNVVGVDIIQRYFKLYEKNIEVQEAYLATHTLIKEYLSIIDYFNKLQDEKTTLFKESGLRITYTNYGKGDIIRDNKEILPFDANLNNPQYHYSISGNTL
jgi:hypothetical protein